MVEIFQLQLHKSSAVPLYQQLAEGIEGMITDGVLLANSKLPHLCFAPACGAYSGACGKPQSPFL